MNDPLHRLYRAKLAFLALLLLVVGLGLLILGHWVQVESSWQLLRSWPIVDIGSGMFTTGLLGVALQYIDGADSEARDTERLERVLAAAAPAMRDAVISGFAESPENMRGVATTETLDRLATNALGLRLGDIDFAREIYADVRDQAIRAPERWYDVQVGVRLSTVTNPDPAAIPRFDVLIEWEYTVRPSHAVARFACVSDRDQFYELVTDAPSTLAWFMTPRPGFVASDQSAFELLSFSVDGEERKIRRSVTKTGQAYSATIGEDVVATGKPVRIRHVYRAITAKESHQLFLEMPQPARDVSLEMDYTATDIAEMRVSDLVTSIQKPRISRLPQQVPAKVINVDIPGWLLPRAGFTFGWTLASEVSQPAGPTPASADARRSA